ncbi:MAG: polymer-forming cytoskeletal protein [Candidatus Eisenbacteria sp.]|nr:polymer-forming cytoskeletal protein [Candidatus Eisenbacteria bacterium]
MNAMRIMRVRQVAVALVRESDVRNVMIRVAVGLLILAVALGILLTPTPAGAVDTGAGTVARNVVHIVTPGHGKIDIRQVECYLVPEGETREADLYIWAQSLEIAGTLDGDIVGGFQEGKITGTVTQDLNGMCETMRITGVVGDDVRFACGTFYLDGHIVGDLIVAAKTVQISETAVIDGDAIIACATVTVDGAIGGRARIMTGFLDMNGTIAGNAEITTDGGMRLGPDVHIGGDLFYEGPSEIDVPEGAVAGEVTFQRVIKEDIDFEGFLGGASVLFHFLGFIAALVAGTIIVALTTDHARRTAEIIRTKPLKSLGIGFVTFICMPIVLLLLLVFILTIPLMFVVGLTYAIALYIARFYFSIWLGNLILRRGGRTDVSPIPSMLLGLTIVYLATAIPIVGMLVGVVIIFFGLGALMQRKETRLDASFEPAPVVSNGLPNEFPGTGTGA